MNVDRRTLLRWTAAAALLTACRSGVNARAEAGRRSVLVPVRDGTRLALDVWLPPEVGRQPVGTVVRLTRYHRSQLGSIDDPTEAADFLRRGWALVKVDARGTGASFGSRTAELSTVEIDDYSDVIDWIAAQTWSDGRVAAYGVSYDGTAAELVTRTGNPHLVAVAPLFSDVDVYRHLAWPGGVFVDPLQTWLLSNDVLDGITGAEVELADELGSSPADVIADLGSVAPIDGPDGEALLAAARREHQANRRSGDVVAGLACVDDRDGDANWSDSAILVHRQAMERSAVPRLVQVGWLDAGTVDGALERFRTLDVPQVLQIAPWAHGGDPNDTIDPTLDGAPDLGTRAQIDALLDFLGPRLGDSAEVGRLADAATIRFRPAGDDRWFESTVWPPATVAMHAVDVLAGSTASAIVRHDPSTTVGPSGRWIGNLAGAPVDHDGLASFDADVEFEVLVAEAATRLVGTPLLDLTVTSDTEDPSLHAYLVVRHEGRTTILSEAHRRLAHRSPRPFEQPTYRRSDLRLLTPNERLDLRLELTTIGACARAGARLSVRLSLGDAGTFRPTTTTPHSLVVDAATLSLPIFTV